MAFLHQSSLGSGSIPDAECFGQMRLKAVVRPDSLHSCFTHSNRARHRPLRGASFIKILRRPSANRFCHVPTVRRVQPGCFAISSLSAPSATANIIFARSTRRASGFLPRDHCCSVANSCSVNSIGMAILIRPWSSIGTVDERAAYTIPYFRDTTQACETASPISSEPVGGRRGLGGMGSGESSAPSVADSGARKCSHTRWLTGQRYVASDASTSDNAVAVTLTLKSVYSVYSVVKNTIAFLPQIARITPMNESVYKKLVQYRKESTFSTCWTIRGVAFEGPLSRVDL